MIRTKTIDASCGDAFLVALALGDVADGDVDAWNPLAGEIAPDPASADVYGRQFAVFKELYPRTKDLMAGLL